MRFAPTEDQLALRHAVEEVLTRDCPPTLVRASIENPTAARGLWSTFAEMGLLDALVSEDQGGMGFALSDIVPLAQAVGRAALPLPFVEHVFLAAPVLGALGDTVVTATDGSLLPYAGAADQAIVVHQGSLASLTRADLESLQPATSVDSARPLVRVPSTLHGTVFLGREPSVSAIQRATLGTAAMLSGLAHAMLDMTVEYVTERKQFGVPIGTFQAIKHHLANVRIALEFTDPMIAAAAWSVDNDQADAELLVAFAKIRANEAAQLTTTLCLQCHGAIGYSYEHDLGLWMKRAWALIPTWGDSSTLRAKAGAALEINSGR